MLQTRFQFFRKVWISSCIISHPLSQQLLVFQFSHFGGRGGYSCVDCRFVRDVSTSSSLKASSTYQVFFWFHKIRVFENVPFQTSNTLSETISCGNQRPDMVLNIALLKYALKKRNVRLDHFWWKLCFNDKSFVLFMTWIKCHLPQKWLLWLIMCCPQDTVHSWTIANLQCQYYKGSYTCVFPTSFLVFVLLLVTSFYFCHKT